MEERWYSHQAGLSDRDLKEEEDSTLWGRYESTLGWFCVSNMADRATRRKEPTRYRDRT